MQLFGYYRSSAAYRLRIALNYKQIDYRQTEINLLKGEQNSEHYLQLNPQGLVPALRTDEGQVLTQSTAILEWLEERYPRRPLLPSDALERARVRAFCNLIACDIHPVNNLRILKYLKGELDISEEAKTQWYQHWITQGFAALESQVVGEGGYCFGEDLSLADVYLVPQMYNARRFNTDLKPFPKLEAIVDRLNKIEAFERATPENQV